MRQCQDQELEPQHDSCWVTLPAMKWRWRQVVHADLRMGQQWQDGTFSAVQTALPGLQGK